MSNEKDVQNSVELSEEELEDVAGGSGHHKKGYYKHHDHHHGHHNDHHGHHGHHNHNKKKYGHC